MAIALILLATAVALYLVWAEPWKRKAPVVVAPAAPAPPEEDDERPVTVDDSPRARAPRAEPREDHDEEITLVGKVPLALVSAAAGDDDEDPDITRVGKISPALLEGGKPSNDRITARPPAEDEVAVDMEAPPDSHPTGPQPRILVSGVACTDTGKKRSHNEDSYIASEKHGLYLVADGMGGYAGGDLASQLTCETILDAFDGDAFDGETTAGRPRRGDELVRAVHMANAAVWKRASTDKKLTGMGTTVVGIRFSANKQRAYYVHVGDSRLYRIRGGVMRQLTRDHTIGEATGATGPFAARLTRAVGIAPLVEVDFGADDPQIGDTYLVCSDGLTKMIDDDGVLDIVNAVPDIEKASRALVAAANERGGRDNVTVVLVRVAAP